MIQNRKKEEYLSPEDFEDYLTIKFFQYNRIKSDDKNKSGIESMTSIKISPCIESHS